jgi:hypothetical protein
MLLAAIAVTFLTLFGAVIANPAQGEALQTTLSGPASYYLAQPVTPTTGVTVTAEVPLTTTATVEVTATATLTTPITQPTPVPIISPEPSLQWNPFDWGFLTSAPPPSTPLGPFAYVLLALMLATLGVGGYFYFVKRPEWKRTNSVLYRAANRFAQPAIWLAVVGLLLILFRIVRFDFFNLRIWLYLWLAAFIALGIWFYLWYRNSYPKEIAKFTKVQRQKQYMPGSGKVSTRASQPVATPAKRSSTPAPSASGEKSATTQTQPTQQRPAQGSKRRKK